MTTGLGWTNVPTLPNAVADWIARGIIAGRWADGDRLREVEIATELGVSRAPVREALRILHEQGLVRHIPRIGAVSAGASTATIVEVYELRGEIEAWLCRRSVPKLGPDRQAELRRLLAEMVARQADNVDGFFDTGWRLRETLYSESGNATALEMVRSLRNRLHSLPQVLRSDEEHIALTLTTYEAVCEAVAAGDADEVARLIRGFMLACGERVVSHFRTAPPPTRPVLFTGNPD